MFSGSLEWFEKLGFSIHAEANLPYQKVRRQGCMKEFSLLPLSGFFPQNREETAERGNEEKSHCRNRDSRDSCVS